MKKILIILFSLFLFADQNPFEQNSTKPITINGITIYNLPVIEENETNNEINTTINNESNETNFTSNKENNITTYKDIFTNTIKTIKPSIDIAVVIDKKLFYKYLPSIINSLNAYLIYKNVKFDLKVYDINETQEALTHKNVIFYTYNIETLNSLSQYKNINFYFPMINKNEVQNDYPNFYFGGIDYKSQIEKLSDYIEGNKIIAINESTLTSQKLFSLETEFFNIINYDSNDINYKNLNNSYIFLNTSPQKSIQILSDIYYQNITPTLILSTQINYSPILIALTQKEALEKLIVANSIINPPKDLSDVDLLLQSDIKFNWLNYSASILCNKIYNKFSDNDPYFMNDFDLFMFDNQINYKTKLYQIVFKAFKEIYSLP